MSVKLERRYGNGERSPRIDVILVGLRLFQYLHVLGIVLLWPKGQMTSFEPIKR